MRSKCMVPSKTASKVKIWELGVADCMLFAVLSLLRLVFPGKGIGPGFSLSGPTSGEGSGDRGVSL